MLRIVLVAIVTMQLAPGSSAEASESSGSSDTLVGWSEDGKTYAVRHENLGDDSETLLVLQEGTVILKLCQSSDSPDQYGNECKTEKGVKTVPLEMERINVKRHKYLKEFKLQRVTFRWRKAFRQYFRLKASHPAKDLNDEHCNRGWKLLRRGDKTAHASEHMVDGCLSYEGGYLHPTGKYVLVKRAHVTWGTDDASARSEHETTYDFVTLPVRVFPSPEHTDKLKSKRR
jgi:hypothetical protein